MKSIICLIGLLVAASLRADFYAYNGTFDQVLVVSYQVEWTSSATGDSVDWFDTVTLQPGDSIYMIDDDSVDSYVYTEYSENYYPIYDGGSGGGGGGPPPPGHPSASVSAELMDDGSVQVTANGSSTGALNEIGIEACDESGTPLVNLGISSQTGASGSYTTTFNLDSLNSPYVQAYAWNADRSELVRSSPLQLMAPSIQMTGDPVFDAQWEPIPWDNLLPGKHILSVWNIKPVEARPAKRSELQACVDYLRAHSPTFEQAWETCDSAAHGVAIVLVPGSSGGLTVNNNMAVGTRTQYRADGSMLSTPAYVLAHEMGHVNLPNDNGVHPDWVVTNDTPGWTDYAPNTSEYYAYRFAEQVAQEIRNGGGVNIGQRTGWSDPSMDHDQDAGMGAP